MMFVHFSFPESFDSLPDDSKRLFARLYTRKGIMLIKHILLIEYAWVSAADFMNAGHIVKSIKIPHGFFPFPESDPKR